MKKIITKAILIVTLMLSCVSLPVSASGLFTNSDVSKLKFFNGSDKVKYIYAGTTKVYSAGAPITYISNGKTVCVEVDEGKDAIGVVTPEAKEGWSFVGWKKDTAASEENIVSSYIVTDKPCTLNAVYRKTVSLTLNGGTGADSKIAYYNAGGIGTYKYPTFQIEQSALSGWNKIGWSEGTGATDPIIFTDGEIQIIDDTSLYSMYAKNITLSYSGNTADSGTVSSQNGIRYYNSSGDVKNPEFTIANNGYTKTNNEFLYWITGEGASYNPGEVISLSKDLEVAVQWEPNILEYATNGIYNWTILIDGYYLIDTYGSKGGDYNGNLGGNGGNISCKVYLKKGQILDIGVAQNGGTGTIANGGGSAYVQLHDSNRIIAAGGGGGATSQGAGQSGGVITSKGTTTNINGGDTSAILTSSESGEQATSSGGAGGGGGWFGGKVGLYTAPVYHRHTGSSSGGGCYSVPHSHYHGGGCYTDYVSLTGSTGVQTSGCGCTSQTWYWRCGYCGATSSSTSNSSAGCSQGHHASDSGSGLSCHTSVLTCTTAQGTYYTLGCGKSTSTIDVAEKNAPSYGGSNGYTETINGKEVQIVTNTSGSWNSGAKVTISRIK